MGLTSGSGQVHCACLERRGQDWLDSGVLTRGGDGDGDDDAWRGACYQAPVAAVTWHQEPWHKRGPCYYYGYMHGVTLGVSGPGGWGLIICERSSR